MLQDRTLRALNLAVFMIMFGVGMIVPLLPQKLIALEGPGAPVGYIASFFALSYILLQVPVGNLSDRLGFKTFMVAGYLLCATAGLLFYFAHSSGLIFLGRLVQGAGEAPLWALAPALLSIKYPLSRGKVMGIYNAVLHLGLTAGPLLGIALASTWTDNKAFLFYTTVCLVGALVILWGVDDVRTGGTVSRKEMRFSNVLALTARKDTLSALLGISLYRAGYGIFLTVLPAYLITTKGFGATNVGVFFTLFYGAISFSQLSGSLLDHFDMRLFMVAGLLTAATGIGTFSMFGQPLVSVMLGLASLGLGVFFLSSLAFLNEVAPDSLKGTISGAYYLFWGSGMFFGPVLVGLLGNLFGNGTGFYIFSLALLLEAMLLAMVSGGKSITTSISR